MHSDLYGVPRLVGCEELKARTVHRVTVIEGLSTFAFEVKRGQ